MRKYYDAGEDSDENWHKKMKKIYTFCHQLISALAKVGEVNLALRLYLQTALAADYTQYEGSENIVYEFVTQAFSLFVPLPNVQSIVLCRHGLTTHMSAGMRTKCQTQRSRWTRLR